jgi:hypothetical protein
MMMQGAIRSAACRKETDLKKKYEASLPRRMYGFFLTYSGTDAPSFCKFATSTGYTTEELKTYRKHKEFERAWRECIEIRRDYLTDRALTKRFDPSFVKFLLTESDEVGTGEDEITVNIKVED